MKVTPGEQVSLQMIFWTALVQQVVAETNHIDLEWPVAFGVLFFPNR